MNEPRVEHTATLLPNGKVLVVGGNVGSTVSETAELFDPATETWIYTGSMNTGRKSFSAILLDNGKVLVAGGMDLYPTWFSSVEIYDPDSGVWSTSTSMNIKRSSPSAAIKLNDGQVLIAGGYNGSSVLSAEIYNPALETWTYTGSLNEAHHYNPAVLLQNGKVLVAGAPTNSSCELYDPNLGTWSYTGSMNVVRRSSAVIMLPNNKVLTVGGSIYFGASKTNTAEVYDPSTGVWKNIDSMNSALLGLNAIKLDNGNILVSGETGAELYKDWVLVFMEQAAGQADPANTSPINFTVTFSEPLDLATFTAEDVSLGGTAGATMVVINEISPNDGTTFNVAVSGMTGSGTVIASIPAGRVQDLDGDDNLASTSIDNEVEFAFKFYLPLIIIP